MIELNQVSVRRDGRVLFSEATFQIHPGQKVGLTGNNGTGKSTLFGVLLNQVGECNDDELTVDAGTVNIPTGWEVAHMAQEVESSHQSAIDYVLSGDKEWYELNKKLTYPETLGDAEIANLYQRFDEIDGYRTPTKAAQIMAGLGFNTSQHELPVNDFSGGWRMRLNLAKTLMCRADLLLLDEPTNHLDLDAILWLEEWIAKFDGTVLLISHDQTFLDATIGYILHIENQKLTLYTGNYSQFVRTRSERLSQQQQAYEKQQTTRAHLEDYIRRFRAKATKAKQAQSRIKQLERMAELSPVMADNPFSFRFYEPSHMSSPLIEIKKADVGYDDVPLLTNVSLQITPDTRIGLLGMNGAGKSTLIKALVGELTPISGTYKVSDSLSIGYFNQHQMDSLDAEATPMLMLRRLAGKTPDDKLRAFLGSFDFKGDRIDTPSKLFSGGERARLTLALIVWQKPNVLVLDEPTNHLDLQMRQALTLALQAFAGAVVLVSHDRELIANVSDELYLVHGGRVEEFKGDVSDYGKWLTEQRNISNKEATKKVIANDGNKEASNKASKNSNTHYHNKNDSHLGVQENAYKDSQIISQQLTKEERRKRAAEQRKLTAPIRKRIQAAEQKLETLENQLNQLENDLADTGLYDESRKKELLDLLTQQSSLQQQQNDAEEEMLTAMSELEDIED